MDNLEKQAITRAQLKAFLWIRYIDDCFVIWPHGKDTLTEFLTHINSIHAKIEFTMEMEKDNGIPFLELDLFIKMENDHSSISTYRKPTHTHTHTCLLYTSRCV